MKYDKEVLTINDILTALDNFDNKEEIIKAITKSLYDIETDWHHEEYLRHQLQSYKQKEDKLREYVDFENDNGMWNIGGAGDDILNGARKDILAILNEGDK